MPRRSASGGLRAAALGDLPSHALLPKPHAALLLEHGLVQRTTPPRCGSPTARSRTELSTYSPRKPSRRRKSIWTSLRCGPVRGGATIDPAGSPRGVPSLRLRRGGHHGAPDATRRPSSFSLAQQRDSRLSPRIILVLSSFLRSANESRPHYDAATSCCLIAAHRYGGRVPTSGYHLPHARPEVPHRPRGASRADNPSPSRGDAATRVGFRPPRWSSRDPHRVCRAHGGRQVRFKFVDVHCPRARGAALAAV